MKTVCTKELNTAQKEIVMELWNDEYPDQLKYGNTDDFDKYLSNLADQEHILYMSDSAEVLCWAFKFSRGLERWFAIILDSSIHKKGIGTLLLALLQENETELNGWVVDHNNYAKSNTQAYLSPLSFYLKNGFKVYEKIRLESPLLSAVKIIWQV